jgi:hypothetical protein
LITASSVSGSGTIRANGGNGGTRAENTYWGRWGFCGGGGGGGRVAVLASSSLSSSVVLSAVGGSSGGETAEPAAPGTIY